MASGPITSWQIDGETVADFIFLGSRITADGDCSREIKRRLVLESKVMTNLDSILKSRDITFPTKVHLVKAISSSHVWMWELDYKENWVLKNWCFWTVMLEKTLESPLDSKEIQPIGLFPLVHPKEINPEYSLEGLMLKRKLKYLATWCEGLTHLKDPDAGKDWRQEEKGTTDNEMVGWHHWLSGFEFE